MATQKKSGSGEFEQATRAAKFILSKTKLRPKIALVLGSGLGAFADEFGSVTRIPYKKIPHFPQSTAIGHAGQLVVGRVGDVPVVGMQGRVHLYEGYTAKQVAFPIRVFQRAGIKPLPTESERLSSEAMNAEIFSFAVAAVACLICASVIRDERLFSAAVARCSPRSAAALYHM